MLRISRGSFAPALNASLPRIWRPVAALTAILVVAVFVGLVSVVGSWTATSLQPVPGAINPPVVRDTGDSIGIPYVGTGPAADIIRGGYVEEIHPIKAPVVRDTGDASGIPYVGTGPAADAIRSGYDEKTNPINPTVVRDTTERTGIPYVGTGPAADIIRGGYVPETYQTKAPAVVRHTGDYVGIPYVGTGPAADIIRNGYVDTSGR